MDDAALDELERVAREATPGARAAWSSIYEGMVAELRATLPGHERGIAEFRKHENGFKDATFAATFDPPTILALITAARRPDHFVGVNEMVGRPDEWQPIRTAPRDGTPILAAVFVHINGIPSHWDRHVIYADDVTGVIHSDAEQGWRWDDYTHWMPLPEAPKEGHDHG